MKRIILTTAYLTVMGTLAFAQLPTSARADISNSPSVVLDAPATAPSAQQTDEVAPLTNLPFFPGGTQALQNYLENRDLYPTQALEAGIAGTVRLRFRVMPDGSLSGVRVIQSQGPLLDQAARQAVAQMPRWYPAYRGGVAVALSTDLLITFRISSAN